MALAVEMAAVVIAALEVAVAEAVVIVEDSSGSGDGFCVCDGIMVAAA